MINVAMTFLLVFGAVLQAVVPSLAILGEARLPVLLGVVLYYALTRPQGVALRAAILAGLVQDGLCMIPLGYSSFCFCVVVLAVSRVKDEVFVGQWLTNALFGAAANAAVTLALNVLLVRGGDLSMSVSSLGLKTAGALLLGGALVPVVFRFAESLERRLGLLEARGGA